MNKIPCEVIQDLMPSYIDGLTSPVTSRVVEEHVEGCEKCRKVLEHMRQPDGTPESTLASVTSAMKSVCVSNSIICVTLALRNAEVQ